MADYNYDKDTYYEGSGKSKKVANSYKGEKLYEGGNRSKALCNVYGDKIYEGHNRSKALCNMYGDKIYEGHNRSKKLGTMKDVKNSIKNSQGGMMDVAFWFKFAR